MFRKTIICLSLGVSCFIQLFAQSTRDFKKELEGIKSIQDTVVLHQKLSALATGSEEDLTLLAQYGLEKGWSRSQWDEFAAKRMPKEQFAFNKAQEKFFAEKDLNKKLAILSSIQKQFPNQKYGYNYALLAGDYARAGNFNQAMAYLQKTKDQDRLMAWSQLALVNDPKISKQVTLQVNQTLLQKNLPAEERLTLLNMKRYLLEQKQDYKNAAVIAKKILDLNQNPTQNEIDHYHILLSKSGNYQAAFPALEKMINKEIEDEEIKTEYKKAYQFMYPNRDVKAHLDSIQNVRVEQYEAKYKNYNGENLIKEKAPEFELLDANSKTVSMKDFKDKIMVIDFWATWCMPCKAALPGMQLLVDKYKNDPEVKFLFIHTKEITGESFNKVRDQSLSYFKAHDFTLPLYVDLKDKDTKTNKVAEQFKVTGIPHKVLIDRNGFIRLNSVGFNGSTPDLVAEMSAVIEKLKNQTN
ncbi:redoxin domain-containing protein [Pedobacter sp. KACC 23697]|uniref:Redoxin domain-containing protein n=1 Tax=Pedobacter sp. KACC 23697 TaxID=3149230 RepID=A0AAU7K8U3_9SPHI